MRESGGVSPDPSRQIVYHGRNADFSVTHSPRITQDVYDIFSIVRVVPFQTWPMIRTDAK